MRVGSVKSRKANVMSRIPQGSILGLALFTDTMIYNKALNIIAIQSDIRY